MFMVASPEKFLYHQYFQIIFMLRRAKAASFHVAVLHGQALFYRMLNGGVVKEMKGPVRWFSRQRRLSPSLTT